MTHGHVSENAIVFSVTLALGSRLAQSKAVGAETPAPSASSIQKLQQEKHRHAAGPLLEGMSWTGPVWAPELDVFGN